MASHTTRKNLNRFFNLLRKDGVIAKRNFSCCQGCGLSEITNESRKVGHTDVAYVFYHRQDAADMAWDHVGFEGEEILTKGCYLAYGFTGDSSEHPERLTRFGDRIQELGRQCNVVTRWDGRSATRIMIVGSLETVEA